MITTEVPRETWISYLDDLSRRCEGSMVTLELLDDDIGDLEEIRDMPLIGISADEKANENSISIAAGRGSDRVTRIINSPRHLWVEETETGAVGSMEIESADGLKTLVHLRPR